MSRTVIGAAAAVLAAALAVPTIARADDGDAPGALELSDAPRERAEPPDQAIAATLGVAAGGRDTPGGLRVGGRWLYRMTEDDWFESVAAFTFGKGDAACFRDRDDSFICTHGPVDGVGAELAGAVRHRILGKGNYQPYLRGGVGIRIDRFGADDVRGLAIPLSAGAGVRVAIKDNLALTGEATVEVGIAWLSHGLGTEPQLGLGITALVEFAL
jgi:hypothetical protein